MERSFETNGNEKKTKHGNEYLEFIKKIYSITFTYKRELRQKI